MDPILLGLIAGSVFAALEVLLVLVGRWPGQAEEFWVLVASAANRFATGLVIPTSDIGLPLWASGLMFGALLAVPIAAVARRTVEPLGLGVVGGITIAAVAQLAT
ncbi:MAG: hypothetical protein O3A10_07285 [Chloroflexi bacterium]|nr:hypothetical protein [Chloroflexota bacterium]MDA1146105.1 hypothetical protein [Chloroflexota bacterium]